MSEQREEAFKHSVLESEQPGSRVLKGLSESERTSEEENENIFLRQDKEGDTYLHILIAKKERERILKLIDCMQGNSLDTQNFTGRQAALHLAVVTEQDEVVKKLISSGANVNVGDGEGNTPLILACSLGKNSIVKILTDTHDTNLEAQNNKGRTALHEAVSNGNEDAVLILIKKKGNINCQERRNSETPLHLAVRDRNIKMTKLLLEKEAYINAVSKNGNTPLHLAIDEFNKGSSHIQRNLVELLIEKGADITAKNGQSQTPQNLAPESLQSFLKKRHSARKNKEYRKRKAKVTTHKGTVEEPISDTVTINQSKRKPNDFCMQESISQESVATRQRVFGSQLGTTVIQNSSMTQQRLAYPNSSMNSTNVLSLPCMTASSPGSSEILSGIPESPPLQDGAVANAVGSIRGNENGFSSLDSLANYDVINSNMIGNFQSHPTGQFNTVQQEPNQQLINAIASATAVQQEPNQQLINAIASAIAVQQEPNQQLINAIASAIAGQQEPNQRANQHLIIELLRLVVGICRRIQVNPNQILSDLGYPNWTSSNNN